MQIIKHTNGKQTMFTTDKKAVFVENAQAFTATQSTEAEALEFLCGEVSNQKYKLKEINDVIHLMLKD